MSRPAKPATIRFYVDADVLGFAKILVQMRSDVTYPGDPGGVVKGRKLRPPCPITNPGTPDRVWIPETAKGMAHHHARPAYPGAPRRDRGCPGERSPSVQC